tara:strand:- start:152 stop:349 length:198 start_codon:yes stop_codon:yes gene_type:complete
MKFSSPDVLKIIHYFFVLKSNIYNSTKGKGIKAALFSTSKKFKSGAGSLKNHFFIFKLEKKIYIY